eukprot:5866866-Prorocentrum_lima.AAC.1
MTSSLVGSEMCIRDRHLWRKFSKCSGVAPDSHCGFVHPNLVSMISTVSYTHLTLPTICSV